MLWDADNERDERKQRFIELMKRRKSAELLGPLSEKLLAWEQGQIPPEEVFRAAGYAGRKGEALIGDFKKRPDVILAGIAMDENRYLTGIGDIGISVRPAEVTGVFSDAIICSVPAGGGLEAGAAALVAEEAGPDVGKELVSKAPLEPGTAVSTGPGDLTTGNIIFVNTAEGSGKVTPGSLRVAVSAALKLAEELNAETLAVPALGAGEGGLVPSEAAGAILEAVKGHEDESVSKILFADRDEVFLGALIELLEKYDEE